MDRPEVTDETHVWGTVPVISRADLPSNVVVITTAGEEPPVTVVVNPDPVAMILARRGRGSR